MAAPFPTAVTLVTSLPLDPPAAPRAQPVLHIGPLDARTVVAALAVALPRVQAATAGVQALIVVPDAELGVEAAEMMPGALSAFTSSHRGARLLASAVPAVVSASLTDALTLVRGAQLKLDALVAVVIAGADVLLERDADALDALLSEVPERALRVATATADGEALAAFAERHLRRARREGDPIAPSAPLATPLHGLVVGAGARSVALRALLDAFDPPSAAIVVASEADAREVRGALAPVGLSGVEPLAAVVTADQVPGNVALLVSWRLPTDAASVVALAATTPVRFVVLHEVGERTRLSALAGGHVMPLDLPAPLEGIRRRDAIVRAELEREIVSGVPMRELHVIAPLLAVHDGVSVAAAALRLLERDRALAQTRRASAAAAALVAAPAVDGASSPRSSDREDRGSRPPRTGGKFGDREDRGSRPPRAGGKFGDRDDRGARPPRAGGKFGDRDAKPRGGPRPAGKFGDRDDRGPRPPRPAGKFGDRDDRGPRPPRAGGKFGDRDASGPRGPVRESRGPSEGGDRREWSDRGEALRRAKRPPRGE